MGIEVGGHVEPGFEGVRDAFANNFVEHGEVGRGYAVLRRGHEGRRPLGRRADADTGAAYDEDTLQLVFSTTKGATAACAHLLAAARRARRRRAGRRRTGPSSGRRARSDIPVRWLLSPPGRPADVDAELTLERGAGVGPGDPRARGAGAALGARASRTATTRTPTAGSSARSCAAIDGQSLGTFFHDEIAEPARPRVLDRPARGARAARRADDPDRDTRRREPRRHARRGGAHRAGAVPLERRVRATTSAPPPTSRDFHAAEIPAANGITNARSLARMYAGLVGGVDDGPSEPLLTARQIDAAPASCRRRAPTRCSRSPASRWSRRSRSGSGRRHRSRRWAAPARSVTTARVARSASPIPSTDSPVAT